MVRSVIVGAGVFAPGHLGELTRQVPFDELAGLDVRVSVSGKALRDGRYPPRIRVLQVRFARRVADQKHSGSGVRGKSGRVASIARAA